jgi:hypothetical protein
MACTDRVVDRVRCVHPARGRRSGQAAAAQARACLVAGWPGRRHSGEWLVGSSAGERLLIARDGSRATCPAQRLRTDDDVGHDDHDDHDPERVMPAEQAVAGEIRRGATHPLGARAKRDRGEDRPSEALDSRLSRRSGAATRSHTRLPPFVAIGGCDRCRAPDCRLVGVAIPMSLVLRPPAGRWRLFQALTGFSG